MNVVPLVIIAAVMLSPAAAGQIEERGTSPSTIVMEFPAALGVMERPAVEFDHAAHTTALEREGCDACHTITDKGLSPRLTAAAKMLDRDDLINAFHDACMSCHTRRIAASLKSGPVTCGECHVRRPPAMPIRAEMRFDYSLHGRHSLAYPEKCDPCHHVWDEERKELRYEKGAEEGCRGCHLDRDVESTPSHPNASHMACVGCHLRRTDDRLDAGPVLCVGCHDEDKQRAIKVLDEVPRLVRAQPDTLWVHTAGTVGKLVPFDHLGHERATSACSDCHHTRLQPCGSCHTLTGADEGGRVALESSHHMPESTHSCAGCHAREARDRECVGCHHALTTSMNEAACVTCHSGPAVAADEEEPPPPGVSNAELPLLPVTSQDFPETVVIDLLVDTYEAVRLPHRKIVERLDRAIRSSRVAAHFHDTVDQICAGCHHHTPVGLRPPPCRSCHGASAHPTLDRPALSVAYHRQCIGCHQQMKLAQQGCEDCHALVQREAQQ
jgi:hypothetical protein